jgi:predicted nucleic acid-binding protein
MIVVADASPLIALASCDCLDVLDKLFGEVKVSDTVYEEVTVNNRLGSDQLKKYLQGKVVNAELASLVIEGSSLDRDELSSMVLYKKLHADYLLIDEKLGRKIAKLNNIKVIGSLGVLIEAKRKGIIPSIKPQIEIFRSSKIYFPSNSA